MQREAQQWVATYQVQAWVRRRMHPTTDEGRANRSTLLCSGSGVGRKDFGRRGAVCRVTSAAGKSGQPIPDPTRQREKCSEFGDASIVGDVPLAEMMSIQWPP